MSVLARKRWRELWRMRGQVLAIALVDAVGVAMLVMSLGTLATLTESRDRYYRGHAFAHVFADLRRAPLASAGPIAALPGVTAVETRVTAFGSGRISGFGDPIQVHATSVPEVDRPAINRLRVLRGRLPASQERDTVALSDAFVEAHALRIGDTVRLTLHGKRMDMRLVGIAGSPEFVAQLPPQSTFPDARRFAIAWLPRGVLEAVMDMDGAFNTLSVRVADGGSQGRLVAHIDAALRRYGGTGAVERADQMSNRYLEEEFRQLQVMARLFPAVFMGVSAFVLYVVLGRLVAAQREQIGTLKAFGYRDREIGAHYMGHALLIALFGAMLGIALGSWLGGLLADIYADFYRLPPARFHVPAWAVALALGVSAASAVAGALLPARAALALPPAEAMRVEPPTAGDTRRLDRYRFYRVLRTAHRLMARSLLRRPMRTGLSVLGLALGTAVMMLGRFHQDAVGQMVDHQYRRANRQDVEVMFVEPLAPRAVMELAALPGVLRVEPQRIAAVVVRHRNRSHRTAVVGLVDGATLRRPLDGRLQPVRPSPAGLLMTDRLATLLAARPGTPVRVSAIAGRQPEIALPLGQTVTEPFGALLYLPMDRLDRLLGDGPRVTGAVLQVDPLHRLALLEALQARPGIVAIERRAEAIANFNDAMSRMILVFTLVATTFGAVLTVGVVYSSAHAALSERARDLASLRVLGFTWEEVVYLLLGELALLTTLALPLGFALGHALIALMVSGFESDLFRIPHYVSPATYALSALATVAAALLAGVLVRARVQRLDLIAVLKARD